MRRWLPVLVISLAWAAPVAATAETPAPAECLYALPGRLELGVVGQPIGYSQDIFCVPNGDTVSNAVIEWGDGRTSQGTIAAHESGLVLVTGNHVYTSPGRFTIRATVTDEANGQSYSGGSEVGAEIRPSSVSSTGCDFTVRRGTPIRSREVALIRAGTPSTNLHATISWGDGTESRGAVTGNGTLRVSGSHRWRRFGRYAIIVTLMDASGHIVARATGRAVVVPGR